MTSDGSWLPAPPATPTAARPERGRRCPATGSAERPACRSGRRARATTRRRPGTRTASHACPVLRRRRSRYRRPGPASTACWRPGSDRRCGRTRPDRRVPRHPRRQFVLPACSRVAAGPRILRTNPRSWPTDKSDVRNAISVPPEPHLSPRRSTSCSRLSPRTAGLSRHRSGPPPTATACWSSARRSRGRSSGSATPRGSRWPFAISVAARKARPSRPPRPSSTNPRPVPSTTPSAGSTA
jgi:hypothetical protein